MIPIQDAVPRKNPPIATWLIILLNCLVFLFELTTPAYARAVLLPLWPSTSPLQSPRVGALAGAASRRLPPISNQHVHPWRLVHLIGNMWALWIFGDNVEDRMGAVRFLFFYLSCGIAAGLVQWFANPHSTLPAVGASGAIAGVMGAYFFLFPSARIIVLLPVLFIPLFFELPAVVYLGIWALTQVFGGTLSSVGPGDVSGIAWWGHVGGFCAGILLHFLFMKRGGAYRRLSRDEYGIEGAWVPAGTWRGYR